MGVWAWGRRRPGSYLGPHPLCFPGASNPGRAVGSLGLGALLDEVETARWGSSPGGLDSPTFVVGGAGLAVSISRGRGARRLEPQALSPPPWEERPGARFPFAPRALAGALPMGGGFRFALPAGRLGPPHFPARGNLRRARWPGETPESGGGRHWEWSSCDPQGGGFSLPALGAARIPMGAPVLCSGAN